MKRNGVFLFSFTLWLAGEIIFCTTLYMTAGTAVLLLNSLSTCVCLFLLPVQILFLQDYRWRELVLIAGITVILLCSAYFSSERQLIGVWLFIMAAKEEDSERIIQRAYHVLLIMLPPVILLGSLGWLDNRIFFRGSVARYSLGFTHPNVLGIWIFQLLACHFYVHRTHIRYRDYAFLLLAAYFAYRVPNSQTAYISMLVLFGASVLYRVFEAHGKRLLHFYETGLIAAAVLVNLLSVLWSLTPIAAGSFVDRLNSLLSGRFSWCHRVYRIYGISLWGNDFVISSEMEKFSRLTEQLYLDNAYMYLLLRMGVAVYLLFSLAYILNMLRCKRQREGMLLVILFVYAVYGVMERGIFMLRLNAFLVSLAPLLYERK